MLYRFFPETGNGKREREREPETGTGTGNGNGNGNGKRELWVVSHMTRFRFGSDLILIQWNIIRSRFVDQIPSLCWSCPPTASNLQNCKQMNYGGPETHGIKVLLFLYSRGLETDPNQFVNKI